MKRSLTAIVAIMALAFAALMVLAQEVDAHGGHDVELCFDSPLDALPAETVIIDHDVAQGFVNIGWGTYGACASPTATPTPTATTSPSSPPAATSTPAPSSVAVAPPPNPPNAAPSALVMIGLEDAGCALPKGSVLVVDVNWGIVAALQVNPGDCWAPPARTAAISNSRTWMRLYFLPAGGWVAERLVILNDVEGVAHGTADRFMWLDSTLTSGPVVVRLTSARKPPSDRIWWKDRIWPSGQPEFIEVTPAERRKWNLP
ncbi:hypothetical protein HYW61_01750 [candidate division WWE3 bacterium]|nr:hypothetical protein [candidate division WWE3 bacterium]